MSNNMNDHLRFLDHQVDSAVCGSENELKAAEYIASVFKSRGFEPTIQEFGFPLTKLIANSVLGVVLFLSTILVGVSFFAIKVIGVVLLLISAVLLIMNALGKSPFEKFGVLAGSQNVVAKHTGVGELAGKNTRPIVLIAHYDTPHESSLVKSGAQSILPTLTKLSVYLLPVNLVCGLLAILLGGFTQTVFWVLAILSTIPILWLSVSALIDNHSLPTEGGNNNKAVLACMFSLLEGGNDDIDISFYEEINSQIKEAQEAEEADLDKTAVAAKAVEVEGERHGEEIIRALGILPVSCEISYVDVDKNLNAVDAIETEEDINTTNKLHVLSADALKPIEEEGDTPSSKSWGISNFMPGVNKFARRSSLLDLPDPSKTEEDPLSTGETGVQPVLTSTEISESAPVVHESTASAQQMVSALPKDNNKPSSKLRIFKRVKQEEQKLSDYLGLDEDFDAKKSGANINSWDNFNDDDSWKGGATPSAKFTVLEGGQLQESEAPSTEDMRDAINEFAEDLGDEPMKEKTPIDEKLLCHDIWFVALGASEAGHYGAQAFLNEYKKQLRGAFVINLDAVGAGELALLSEEGFTSGKKKADRRVSRIISSTAKEMGMQIESRPYNWKDTDATPFMRRSLRSVTLMGQEKGLPANWGAPYDTIEEVDEDQMRRVVALIKEVIRRS